MSKQEKEFDIRTYSNGLLHIVIGRFYSAEGYSGMTDGVIVKGKLTEVDVAKDSATIWDEKLNCPCAVKLRSLNDL